MADAATKRDLWHRLTWPWRVLVVIALVVALCGAVLWRVYFNDELYYWGIGMVAIGAIAVWATYFANRDSSDHDT